MLLALKWLTKYKDLDLQPFIRCCSSVVTLPQQLDFLRALLCSPDKLVSLQYELLIEPISRRSQPLEQPPAAPASSRHGGQAGASPHPPNRDASGWQGGEPRGGRRDTAASDEGRPFQGPSSARSAGSASASGEVHALTLPAAQAGSGDVVLPGGSLQSVSSGRHPWSWRLEGQQQSGLATTHSSCRTTSGEAAPNEAAVDSGYSSSNAGIGDRRESGHPVQTADHVAAIANSLQRKRPSLLLDAPAALADHHVATPDTPVPLANGAKTAGGAAELPACIVVAEARHHPSYDGKAAETWTAGGSRDQIPRLAVDVVQGRMPERSISANKPPLSARLANGLPVANDGGDVKAKGEVLGVWDREGLKTLVLQSSILE